MLRGQIQTGRRKKQSTSTVIQTKTSYFLAGHAWQFRRRWRLECRIKLRITTRTIKYTRAVFVGGVGGLNPPAQKCLIPLLQLKTQGGRLSMYLCISTVVDFNSQNFDPPNEIWQIQPWSTLWICGSAKTYVVGRKHHFFHLSFFFGYPF